MLGVTGFQMEGGDLMNKKDFLVFLLILTNFLLIYLLIIVLN